MLNEATCVAQRLLTAREAPVEREASVKHWSLSPAVRDPSVKRFSRNVSVQWARSASRELQVRRAQGRLRG